MRGVVPEVLQMMKMTDKRIEAASRFFAEDDRVVLAYVFGSVPRGRAGPLSDIDFAVLLRRGCDVFDARLKLMEALAASLKTDGVDLVALNDAPLLLRYEVVRDGTLLKDEPSARVAFETAVLREYLDTAFLRDVQRRFVKEQAAAGGYFG